MQPRSLLLKTDDYRVPLIDEKRLVPRPRLLTLLDGALDKPATVVHAPGGYGKTTAVALWCRRRKINAAWIRLDVSDAVPGRFASRIHRACEVLAEADQAASPDPFDTFQTLDAALDLLSGLQGEACIVLDDWHMLAPQSLPLSDPGLLGQAGPQPADLVEWLTGRLPEHAHLIVLARSFPHAGLLRLSLDGRLLDVNEDHLGFSKVDTASFCQIMGMDFTPEQIEEINRRTAGWPSAHVLFSQVRALHPKGTADPAGSAGADTGNTASAGLGVDLEQYWKPFYRLVFDYLYDETLRRMPGHVVTFLMAAACLDEANESLMASVLKWSHADVSFCMGALEDCELFTETRTDSLGQACYAVSPLVKEAVRGRGILRSELRYSDVMSRAAAWYLRKEDHDRAVRSAAAAQNWDFAADVILQRWNDLLSEDDFATIRDWMGLLPATYLKSRPKLCVMAALPFFVAGRREYAFSLLKCAHDALKPGDETLLGLYHANRGLCLSYLDMDAAVKECAQALRRLPESERHFRSMSLQVIGGSQVFARPERALVNLEKSVKELQGSGYRSPLTSAYANAASTAFNGGNLGLARRFAQQARDTAGTVSVAEAPMLVMSDVDEAYCSLLVGDFKAARESMQYLLPHLDSSQTPFTLAIAHLLSASLAWLDGDRDRELTEARQALEASVAWTLRAIPPLTLLSRWLQAGLLTLGEAYEALDEFGDAPICEFLRVFAQTAAQVANPDKSEGPSQMASAIQTKGPEALFQDCLNLIPDIKAPQILIAAHILCCHVAERLARPQQAEEHLSQAFSLAAEQGIVWPFVADSALILGPWGRVATKDRSGFAARLLKDLPATSVTRGGGASLSALSERELEVLKLAGQGLSTQGIASRLLISKDTAKKHLGNAYGKLGVHSRTQAVAALRQAGLL